MKSATITTVLIVGILFAAEVAAKEPRSCPRTLGSDKVFAEPWPQSSSWFGTEALAVILPVEGVWPTTKEGHSITVKLFWWSLGFEPGMESDLTVSVKSLYGEPNNVVVSKPTNAGGANLGDWTMLVGLDFPSPGCWEITGNYRGQSLTFIVKTVEHDEARRNGT